jgi:predicted LPLAT superfamily acyltransferase
MTRTAAREWTARPERSNVAALRLIVWIALRLGRSVARAVLHPATLYFLVSARAPREASRAYLTRALGRAPRWRDLYRHYHTFAATVLDRVFFLNDRFDAFDVRVVGEDVVARILATGGGCFLLGAHYGSFEAVRTVGRRQSGLEVSLVMYEENARNIGAVVRAINPKLGLKIIPAGQLQSMIRVRKSLEAGEFVGMMADRALGDGQGVEVTLLGGPVSLPAGPFRLALMLARPVVLMFGIYRGGNRYEVHFEELDVPSETGGGREEALSRLARAFAARLEHYCRDDPYNWFNFYDFWWR